MKGFSSKVQITKEYKLLDYSKPSAFVNWIRKHPAFVPWNIFSNEARGEIGGYSGEYSSCDDLVGCCSQHFCGCIWILCPQVLVPLFIPFPGVLFPLWSMDFGVCIWCHFLIGGPDIPVSLSCFHLFFSSIYPVLLLWSLYPSMICLQCIHISKSSSFICVASMNVWNSTP